MVDSIIAVHKSVYYYPRTSMTQRLAPNGDSVRQSFGFNYPSAINDAIHAMVHTPKEFEKYIIHIDLSSHVVLQLKVSHRTMVDQSKRLNRCVFTHAFQTNSLTNSRIISHAVWMSQKAKGWVKSSGKGISTTDSEPRVMTSGTLNNPWHVYLCTAILNTWRGITSRWTVLNSRSSRHVASAPPMPTSRI